MRWLWAAGHRAAALPPAQAAAEIADGVADHGFLSARSAAILRHVIWLTLSPRSMTADHLIPLRAADLSDDEIHDVVHVACCFAYMNRLADGLGVSILEAREALAVELFGEDALSAHRAWGAAAR